MALKVKKLVFDMNQAKGIEGTYTISTDLESYYRCWFNDTELSFKLIAKVKTYNEAKETCQLHHEQIANKILKEFFEEVNL